MNEEEQRGFIVSREDWSLHRKGYQDQRRHQERVKEAVRKNLPDIVTEEQLILSGRKGKKVRVPIRSLDEYKFRYNDEKSSHVGQGDGDTEVGDVIGQTPGKGGEKGRAGDQKGEDHYEAEIDIAELEQLMFEQMELPNLVPKQQDQLEVTDIEFKDVRKQGLFGNVDKRRTITEAIKRNAMKGKTSLHPIYPEDLRFKTWEDVQTPESKAVIIAMMDTSGSMGRFEKFMARSFFFWMMRFLRTQYEQVEVVFIAHHTEAKVVDEDSFFSKGESGGTICSSAYRKALEVIQTEFSPSQYNIYPFHFSDGDNLLSDNKTCVPLIEQIAQKSQMMGYAEVNVHNKHSTLMSVYQSLDIPQIRSYILRENKDVFHALTAFFQKQVN
ncbi:sporulation protein YhbH [Salsuginibacillus kocurii]|uniref:sporulation protein YhbH n=1 Tax=Salsuginibacillus kocurii TaxID=427078 RepID=UPI00037E3F79|nr:sporulation protein YhbH [Salsuginibacillus kocurii]